MRFAWWDVLKGFFRRKDWFFVYFLLLTFPFGIPFMQFVQWLDDDIKNTLRRH